MVINDVNKQTKSYLAHLQEEWARNLIKFNPRESRKVFPGFQTETVCSKGRRKNKHFLPEQANRCNSIWIAKVRWTSQNHDLKYTNWSITDKEIID